MRQDQQLLSQNHTAQLASVQALKTQLAGQSAPPVVLKVTIVDPSCDCSVASPLSPYLLEHITRWFVHALDTEKREASFSADVTDLGARLSAARDESAAKVGYGTGTKQKKENERVRETV